MRRLFVALVWVAVMLNGPDSVAPTASAGSTVLSVTRVTDINTTGADSTHQAEEAPYHQEAVEIGATVFFQADDGSTGWELWKTDGTQTGTVIVSDIQPL